MTSMAPNTRITIDTVHTYLNDLLNIQDFQDYCPNGLQVAGKTEVQVVVSAVSASLAAIEAACDYGAQVLLVHHGYFWKGEDPCITGIKKNRLQRLLAADLNLLAYHLPLDAHPSYGNNVQLAQRLGFILQGTLDKILHYGKTAAPIHADALCDHIGHILQRPPLHIKGAALTLEKIAWCSGGAQDYLERAARAGMDAYISGEISERSVHIAREYGIHYFAAGHHATERYGVQALGQHLAQHFGIIHHYVELDNVV
jgi:dinuclear metal center YbgI/SA1388 family protein